MREIIFRGKREQGKRKGQWVEGDLAQCPDYEIFHGKNNQYGCPVIPETVGQYTGLTDKNGAKIFEGDIVRRNRFACDGEDMVGYIVYGDCCFSVKERGTPNSPAMDLCDDFEVIGNIHDNPELLEVQE